MKASADVYILGGSQTDFARNWAREGHDLFDMFAETLREAVTNADIDPGRIQVGHVGNFVGDLFAGQGLIGGFFVAAPNQPRRGYCRLFCHARQT